MIRAASETPSRVPGPRRAMGWCTALLTLAILPATLQAQSRTSSALRGSVTSDAGAAVQGAEVVVRHTGTGSERRTGTNAEGGFLFLVLQPGGPYEVTVSSLGFADYTLDDLVLPVGETTALEITLVTEAIELEGVSVDVDPVAVFDRNLVGPTTRLSERTIESLPILSRDIMELALLSPLVKRTEGGGFSIAGQNDRYNAILVDGVLNKDLFGLTAGGVPGGQAGAKLLPLDAVSQYEILVAPFDVRLSGFTGGVMNAVTRSGTNDWRIRGSGVHRAEALMGDLDLVTGPVDASGIDRSLVALSVGGPIARDEAHFFVAGEFERRHRPPVGFNLGRDAPTLIRVAADSVQLLQERMSERFGLDAGTAEAYSLGQDVGNLFGRLDWTLDPTHRLTARYVFARASNDEAPNRTGFDAYELASNAVFRTSTSHTASVQLFSDFGDLGANEAELTVRHGTDDTRPAADWPQIEIDQISTIDGASYQRGIKLGGDYFAQENALSQTSVRLTNTFDFLRGENVITLGATGGYHALGHTFLPGARGEYWFAGSQDFVNNAVSRYQRTELAEGMDPEVRFGVLEWGAFAQNQLNLLEGLTMRFGLRIESSHVLEAPGANVDVLDYFGYRTEAVPSGRILVSPRWGINWQSGGERQMQLRAGVGLFSGQIPYVWLANAFHEDGLRSHLCTSSAPFDPDQPPGECAPQRSVVTFEEGFVFPQDLKFSAAADRELSDSWSASLGILFNKAINQVGIENLNIRGAVDSPGEAALSLGSRRQFYEGRGAPFEYALLVTNEGEDWGASVTAELRGQIGDRARIQLGYALAKAWDRMSLVFTDMASNYGMNPVAFGGSRPPLGTSNFDRPHKVVAALSAVPFASLPTTEISLLYSGRSGTPFSFVYDFDLNGDGFPGDGGAFERTNDLVFVPEEATHLPATLATQILTAGALSSWECLQEFRGRLIERNGCRTPWENRLDLRLAHTVRLLRAEVRLEADLVNVLNLFGDGAGAIQTLPQVVPLYEECGPGCPEDMLLRWGGAVLPTRREDGGVRPSLPWNPLSPDSQWQLQLGARVTFGGAGS